MVDFTVVLQTLIKCEMIVAAADLTLNLRKTRRIRGALKPAGRAPRVRQVSHNEEHFSVAPIEIIFVVESAARRNDFYEELSGIDP